MDTNRSMLNIRNLSIWCMATIYFFFPRRFYLSGIYSFRLVLIVLLLLLIVNSRFKITYKLKLLVVPTLFFGMVFIRYLISDRLSSGLGYLLDSIFLIVLMTNLIRTKRDFEKYIEYFCSFIGVYSILGICECLTGINIWNNITNNTHLVYVRYGLHRSYGSMTNFTNNGFFLLLSTIIVLWKIQNCRSDQKRRYISIFILVNLNLLGTLTRSVILIAFLLYTILLVRGGVIKLIKNHFGFIILIVASFILMLIFSNKAKTVITMFLNMFLAVIDEGVATSIRNEFGGNVGGIGHRFQLYEWVFEKIKGKEVFGVGPQLFTYNWIRGDGKVMLKESLENEYLSVLYRFGFVGLSLYIVMIFGCWAKIMNERKKIKLYSSERMDIITWYDLIITIIPIYYIAGLFYAYADDARLFIIILCLFFSILNNSSHNESCISE